MINVLENVMFDKSITEYSPELRERFIMMALSAEMIKLDEFHCRPIPNIELLMRRMMLREKYMLVWQGSATIKQLYSLRKRREKDRLVVDVFDAEGNRLVSERKYKEHLKLCEKFEAHEVLARDTLMRVMHKLQLKYAVPKK